MDKSKLGATAASIQSKTLNTTAALGATSNNSGSAAQASTMKKGNSAMGSSVGQKTMKKQEKSSEEEVMSKEIQSVEIARLAKVFEQLTQASQYYNSMNTTSNNTNQNKDINANNSSNNNLNTGNQQLKDTNTKENGTAANNNNASSTSGKDYFTAQDVQLILHDLDYTSTKAEVDQMIWEVDENLDGRVNSYEFNLMYRRCRHDTTGLEPRNLYNLVQFLMYLKSDTNVNSFSATNTAASNTEPAHQKKTITVEDTLELLYVRYGRQNLDKEIEEIFGKEEKTAQGEEKNITLKEYLEKQRKRDFAQRKELEAERKKVKMPESDKDEHHY